MSDVDEARQSVLDFLYEHHQKARGVRAQEVGVRDLQKAMKAKDGLSQQEVAASLDYLVQRGWVREVVRERQFVTPGGTRRSQEQVTYKISDTGIDQQEGPSRFERTSPYGAINISNVQGAVVFGDRNVVNTKFVGLASDLSALREALSKSTLSDEDKVAAVAEVETIQTQLAKAAPNTTIVAQAWQAVERFAAVAGLAELALKVAAQLGPLM